ncbi:adenosylhomocysteine nucleosidase [Orenia metallireducens]|uniref:adenosylhomocysteine nucleosidase n=1 Tax=Orenia metallireducens TaxID=1413210 RepID=A0A285HQM4_9FIRM|nr:5'-methylthioadenosine/adenosylhomocysteine nucleosidase [Orenia metallireducens]PRX25082.1 adenosylhomocysteine nucleosidase [Orenia metallireducens]SNY38005.1 adenosylhomocysteine nucleosidase [Orenia metallireducens]
MKIGIIGAMDIEIELLKKDLELKSTLNKASMEFYEGNLTGKEVVLVRSGIGKVNAAVCTQILIDDFDVNEVIFTGVAGAVDPTLDVGDIVISNEVAQHDVDVTGFGREYGEVPGLDRVFFEAEQRLVDLAKEAGEKVTAAEEIKVVTGRILSGDQFIADREKVAWLGETFAGHCTEMEGAAVGQVCFLNAKPFVIIRSMSDKADGEANISFDEFAKIAADNSYQIVVEMLKNM